MTDLEQRARDAISISAGDYERRAKVNRLAAEEDLPADFVDANLDYVEKEKLRKGLDLSDAPNTAEFYSAPSNAEVAGDDVDKFARWEREIKRFDDGKFFGEHTLKVTSDSYTQLGTKMTRILGTLSQSARDKLIQTAFYSLDGGREKYADYLKEKKKKELAGESVDSLESFRYAENPYFLGEHLTSPEDVQDKYKYGSKAELATETLKYVYDQGIHSLVHMPLFASPIGMAAETLYMTQDIAEQNAFYGSGDVDMDRLTKALPFAISTVALDFLGARGIFTAGQDIASDVTTDFLNMGAKAFAKHVGAAGGKAGLRESTTEFVQGIIEYVGARFGTEQKIDVMEALEQGGWGALAAGPMGQTLGSASAAVRTREQQIIARRNAEVENDFDSLREQDLLDSVITQSQEFASVKRAPEVVEQFFQSVGGDKSVLIPQSVVRQAIAEGAEIPPVLTGKLDPTGLDIRVPLSEFVTQIATNPDLVNLLRPHMRMREDGVSLSDIESRINRPTIEAMLGRQDKVTRIQKENAEALKELEDGLVATGMHSKNTARLVVRLYAEYADRVSTDLKNAGHDVEVKDVIERARLKFAGPKADLSGKWAFENAAKEMVNLGRIEKEDFQKLDVSVQRDMVAQFNAAKPKERGGLGLRPDNTREERAKAMGRELVVGEVYDPITSAVVDTTTGDVSTPTIAPPIESAAVGVSPEQIDATVTSTGERIKRRDIFEGVGEFSVLGGSDTAAVPVRVAELSNGSEIVQYANPNTGSIDVILSAISDHDFVGFYRMYENGRPTNKWSSKYENQSGDKAGWKVMMRAVQDALPPSHEYIESTSISTDGLRVWAQQLKHGYKLQHDVNGNVMTRRVAINGDAISNVLGIDVNVGSFDNVIARNRAEFETAKAALVPFMEALGLNESNIHWEAGRIEVDLPVLLSRPADMRTLRQETLPDKIVIDGVERHTRNSDGKQIAANEEGVRNFWAWFGESKVVDKEGRPLVVYHGTGKQYGNKGEVISGDVDAFRSDLSGKSSKTGSPEGTFFFTDSADIASTYTVKWQGDFSQEYKEGANVMPLYLKIEKPEKINAKGEGWRDVPYKGDFLDTNEIAVIVKSSGRKDGIIISNVKDKGVGASEVDTATTYIAFDPTQIKSVYNRGTFSGETGNILRQSAFHGSPYRFDKFSLDHMGKGEGAQAYGYGLYFAGDKEVAEYYRQVLTVGEEYVDGQILDSYNPMHMLAKTLSQESGDIGATAESLRTMARPGANKDVAESAKSALVLLEQGSRPSVEYRKADGQLYRVEIPEDDTYILWDKPLSEQSEVVRELLIKAVSKNNPALAEYWKKSTNMDEVQQRKLRKDLNLTVFDILDTGGAIYESFGNPENASKYLNSLGINGIKYLDGTSRDNGDGSYNYVIFDDAAIEIVETYYQQQGETQAVIHNFPFGDRVIQLFDKQNLSSVLHESAHLFLLMEADLAAEFGVTPKQEALLKWLGVESFDDIRRVHHEKFARTFEAYLFEGKAPSLALADVFSRMKEWMVRVYEFIRNIPEAQIDQEVREIFDRLLATDQKIEEMRANPAYDQFFSSKESAGMSQAEWEKYLEKVKRSESKAKETVDEKLLKEWKRYRMKEWIEERDVIRDNEEVILKGQPVYKAVEALKKGKLNRAQVEQLMNVDLDADKAPLSLLEFAKSIGGMNVDDFISHGVDPADMKVFPRGTFTKDGKTLGGFAEAAAEEGYIVGTSSYEETYEDSYDDNDFLDLVMREIHGEKAYTSEGMEYFAQKDADEKYQEDYFAEHGEYPAAPEETEQDKLIKKLKKMSKKDGLDIALFSADMGFESPRDMMDQVLSVRPVKEQAKENAQAAMLDKYGDSLRDDVLQEEVKEALANEDTAELVLMEINAMNRKVKRKSMDMEYIKQKARDLIAKMKKKEMRPSSYYNMMLKAAEKSKKANSEAAKINAAIAVERSKAAEELMAEVSEQAKEAKVEYDKAEKDYKEKAESARDVSRDKAVAKKKYDEAKKISDEARKQADELIKATEKAKKKSAKKPGDIALKAEYDALVESRDVAKKSAADAEKETAKFKSLMERLANDYNSLFDLQVAAKKVMDNQKKIMEEQGFRLEEKTGRAAELKTEAGKKLLDLEKDLDRVSKEAAEAKAQQLANHHLFKEATEAQKRIDTQVRYLRKVKAKTYNPKEVDPDYIAQAKALINLFDMKHYKAGMTAEEKSQHQADMDRELDRILTWYESQVMSTEKLNELNQDENGTGNRNTLQWLSEDLVAALAAKKEASDKGVPFTFKMTNIEDMTAGQIQGLYDTIKNIRLVGGKNSEYSKAEYQREQESIGEEVKEHSTKTITPTMEPTLMEGAKRTFKAEWSSMRNIHGILYTLAGGNPDSKLMKAYESIVDAVNRHITLEHDFAKVINDAMGPILRTMANPFNHNYTKADGKVWSLSNQARFTLLMNMGNQSNLDALILGFNNTYPEMGVFTHADLLGMVSGMGKPVYEAANKIWAYKDSVTWPLSSAIQRKVDGVTTAKIDPVPFVVDGFSLTGGHYRLHYIPLEGEGVGKDIGEETHASKTMNMGKIASQFSRVGSGGRAVDIGTFHLYRDIDEELRFIAYKELTIKMSRMFNGVKNPLRGAIVRHYGREYMQNLEDTIGRMVNPQVVKSGAWAKIGRYVRTNMVYAFLAFSIRNVMQATYSFATGAAQLGGADYVIWSLLKFYSNPMENFKEVHESSAYMRDRVVFINHETMTQMSRLSMWSPLMTPLKKVGWSLHAVVDGMQAYPYWMEAKRQYLRDNQVTKDTDFKAREKAANDYADLTVKQIMGSGHPLDIGSAFTNPDELHKNLVFMGAFANTTYNANAHNIEAFKRGKIPWYELARRLGWYTVLGPIMVMGVLGQLAPEEDEDEEDFWKRIMLGILGYNAGQVIGLGHLSNIFLNDRGFDLPMFQAIESAKSVGKIAGQVYGDVTGEEDIEFDARMQARLVRSLSMMFPIFGASQWAKLIEGYDDDNQDFWGMLVEGKQK